MYSSWFFEVLTKFEGKRFRLEPYQLNYLLDESPFKVTVKARQSGGSMQVALAKMYKAYRREAYRCDIVSVNLKEATDKIRYIRNFWESLPETWQIPLTTDNALSIGFHDGYKRSIIHSIAASTGVRGGKKDIVFDEAAFIPKFKDLFVAAAPATSRGGGALDIVSTPMGLDNLFAEIYENREREGERPYSVFSRHKFVWFDVSEFVTDREAAQRAWVEEYDESRIHMREMVKRFGTERIKWYASIFTWEQFEQEYCGVFVDEATAFFTWELINRCAKGSLGRANDGEHEYTEDYVEPWSVRPESNANKACMGVDFATSQAGRDKTAIQVCEEENNGRWMHRYTEILEGVEWADFDAQVAHIAEIAAKMRVNKVACDNGHLGIALIPRLKQKLHWIDVEAVNFTNESKQEMALNLKGLMEQNRMWLQAGDKKLHGQIHNMKRTQLPGGGMRYDGKPHDDMFWALCLSVMSATYKPFAMYRIG